MVDNNEQDQEVLGDVGGQRIARVYAEALLNAAQKENRAGEILQELDSLVHEVFAAQPEFEVLLSSAAVGRKARAEVLRMTLGGRADELLLNFLLVLNDNDRLDLLRPILAAYVELHDTRAGRVRVQVQSAIPLPEDEREKLIRTLRETFHVEPILKATVDAGLLGGLRVKIGDILYDASVRTRLETLRDEIIARSSHEIQSQRNRFCVAG